MRKKGFFLIYFQQTDPEGQKETFWVTTSCWPRVQDIII